MDSTNLYTTLQRLLQIEGPSFADNVVDTFEESGIPKDKVEEVLVWAIGDDFHRIQIRYWPHRLRERLGLDVKDSDKIKDTLPKIAEKWLKAMELADVEEPIYQYLIGGRHESKSEGGLENS